MITTSLTDASAADQPAPASAPPAGGWRISLGRTLQWIAVIWIAVAAVIVGVELRAYLFLATVPVRFEGDINNAFGHGGAIYRQAVSLHEGDGPPTLGEVLRAYVQRYDFVASRPEARFSGQYGLDYPPGRLLVMTLWARSVIEQGDNAWRDEHLWPLLHFNAVMGALGAAGAFMLVRYWRTQGRGAGAWNAIWCPLIAALLLWFNLAVLVNAHAWPQWDVWMVPFYLWAAYFGSRRWWMVGGVVIGVGCMFKGQLLLGAPVLALWPLFQGRVLDVLRALVGVALGMSLCTAVWLVGERPHVVWLVTIALAGVICWWVGRYVWKRRADVADHAEGDVVIAWRWRKPAMIVSAIVAAAVLVLWPWVSGFADGSLWMGGLVLGVIVLAVALPRELPIGLWCATLVTMGLWFGALMFGGSLAWLKIGFLYGTDHHRGMHAGIVYNLGGILAHYYGWRLDDVVVWSGKTLQITMRQVYGGLVVLLAIAAAMQAWRRSPRVLIAIAAPWLMMYAVMVQMHERYLMYAAAFSAILVGVSFGMTLLHLLLTFMSAAAMWHVMDRRGTYLPEVAQIIQPMFPGAGWMTLMIAAVFLVVALMPESGRSRLPLRRGGAVIGD